MSILPPCGPGRHRVRPLVAGDGDAHDPEERGERELHRRLPPSSSGSCPGRPSGVSRNAAKTLTVPRSGTRSGRAPRAVPVGDDAVRDPRRVEHRHREQVAGPAPRRATGRDHMGAVQAGGLGGEVRARQRDRLGKHRRGTSYCAKNSARVAALVLEDPLVAQGVDRELGPRRPRSAPARRSRTGAGPRARAPASRGGRSPTRIGPAPVSSTSPVWIMAVMPSDARQRLFQGCSTPVPRRR